MIDSKRLACAMLFIGFMGPACSPYDPTAPAGATLAISANPLVIGLHGDTSTITVRIVRDDGRPALDGTVVQFESTSGTIPQKASVSHGVARVELVSGDRRGVAMVTATSGASVDGLVSASVEVRVGEEVEQLSLSASPATLPPGGGLARVQALLLDPEGQPVADVPVSFSASAGTLTRAVPSVVTNARGIATVRLRTEMTSTITVASAGLERSLEVVVEDSELAPDFEFSPTEPLIGEWIAFNAAASTPITDISRFDWDFGDGDTGRGRRVRHRFVAAGTFSVTLVVRDGVSEAAVSKTVPVSAGEPPEADFVFSPTDAIVGEPITFNASVTTSSSDIVSYSWDFGDGGGGVGRSSRHTYRDPRTYSVTLMVTDANDLVSTTSKEIAVGTGEVPVASFTYSPDRPAVGQVVTFDGSSSFAIGGGIVEYSWDPGDGTSPIVGGSRIATHSYDTPGSYTITLIVRDAHGQVSSAASAAITVGP